MKMPFLLFKKIKEARLRAGFSQNELAGKLGVSNKTISAYELGRAIPPSTTIAKIATITSANLDSFFTDSQSRKEVTLEEIYRKISKVEEKIEKLTARLLV